MSAKRGRPSKLETENAQLKAENEALKKQAKLYGVAGTSRRFGWRSLAVVLCLIFAATLLFLGNIFFWAGNTIVDTNKFVATVGPVIQQPTVQKAVAQSATTKLFSTYDVQGVVQQVLPPRADFLAPQLTSQLQSQTQNLLQKTLASDKFQTTWTKALTRSHDRIISYAKTYKGNGDINLGDVYSGLSKNLASTKLSFLANKQLPAKVSDIHVTTFAWLPVLHKLVNNIGTYQTVSITLFIVFSVLAVWLARNRNRATITLSILLSLTMLLTLVSIRIAKSIAVSKVSPDYQAAVRDTLGIIFHPLVTQSYILLLITALIGIGGWISGPYKSSRAVKSRVNYLLAGKLHESIFGKKENGFTLWVGKHKRTLQILSVIVIVLLVLLATLTPALVVVSAIILVLLLLLIELLAAS